MIGREQSFDGHQSAKHAVFSRINGTKSALRQLPEKDAWEVAGWLQDYLAEKWDRQIDGDIAAGRLDKLADQALADYRAGKTKPLDEILDQP